MKGPFQVLGRLYFFFFGFHWVDIKGKRVTAEEAPILVMAPHSSFFDVFAVFLSRLPCGVSRIENSRPPLFGSTYTSCMFTI